MHHTHHLLALALLAAASAPAQAQSSVTLNGVADLAVRQVSNQGKEAEKSLISGGNSTSRLVFRGLEDLGGGLSAGFHLEHGMAMNNGTPTGGFWDRRATLSLVSKSLGELRLGRDFVPTYLNWSRYDPFAYVGVAGSTGFFSGTPTGPVRSSFGSNANTTVRASNAVMVFLPAGLAGLEGGAMVAAREGGTAATGQGKSMGLRLGWSNGPVGISVARMRTENNLTTVGTFNDTALGGHLHFSAVQLSAVWRKLAQNVSSQTHLLLAAVVPVGAGQVKLSWHRSDMAGKVGATVIDANDSTRIGLGYVHNLSRRTALYATLARVDNDGNAAFAVPGGAAGMAGGGKSSGYEAGIRHNF